MGDQQKRVREQPYSVRRQKPESEEQCKPPPFLCKLTVEIGVERPHIKVRTLGTKFEWWLEKIIVIKDGKIEPSTDGKLNDYAHTDQNYGDNCEYQLFLVSRVFIVLKLSQRSEVKISDVDSDKHYPGEQNCAVNERDSGHKDNLD